MLKAWTVVLLTTAVLSGCSSGQEPNGNEAVLLTTNESTDREELRNQIIEYEMFSRQGFREDACQHAGRIVSSESKLRNFVGVVSWKAKQVKACSKLLLMAP